MDKKILTAKGGLTVEEKTVRWEIQNFDKIVRNDELLLQQKLPFEIIDGNGVKSAWEASLSFPSPPTLTSASPTVTPEAAAVNKNKGKMFRLHTILQKKHGCCSEISVQISAKLQDEVGTVLFTGTPSEELGLKRGFKDDRIWEVRNFNPDNKTGGTLVITLTLKLYSLISEPVIDADLVQLEEEICGNRKARFFRKIGMLENDEKNSDVKIISSEGREFYAYRWILSDASEVFEAMFRVDMTENATGVVTMTDLSGVTLKMLLHFIYTGKVAHELLTNPGIVEELIYAADKYQIGELKSVLDRSMGKICTTENAGALLSLAEKTSMNKAVSDIMNFVREKCNDPRAFFEIVKNTKL